MAHRIFLSLLLACSVAGADPIEDFFGLPGPFSVVKDTSTGPGNDFTLYTPAGIGSTSFLHPVITWGNGTFATPALYDGLLEHLASYGFVIIASNALFTGSGSQMIEGVDWVLAENDNPASSLFGAIDTGAVGATGHSQGGGGTINAGNDPRVRCTAPIQPIPGDEQGLQGPMFLLAGGADFIVPASSVESNVYDPSPVTTFYGVLDNGTHFDPLGDGNGYRGYVTAWFNFCLRGNPVAAAAFIGPCTLCNNPDWTVQRKAGQ